MQSDNSCKRVQRQNILILVSIVVDIVCAIVSCNYKKPEGEYAVVDRFIDAFGTEKITDVSEMDIQGADYRHEFRLYAYSNAVGKKGHIDGGDIQIVNYGGKKNSEIRVYGHVDTVEQATDLCTTVVKIFDSSISESELRNEYSGLYSHYSTWADIRFSITPVQGYITERSSGGYDVLVDCSRIQF